MVIDESKYNWIPWEQPALTSNTSWGTVSATSVNTGGHEPYTALDKNMNTQWETAAYQLPADFVWEFEKPLRISKIVLINKKSGSSYLSKSVKVYAEKEKTTLLASGTFAESTQSVCEITFDTPVCLDMIVFEFDAYKAHAGLSEIQFTADIENGEIVTPDIPGIKYKVNIAGTDYPMDKLFSGKITYPLFETFSCGNACAAQFTFQFESDGTIPKMAKIIPYAKKGSDIDWTQLGVFFVDTRSLNGGLTEITAYDDMLRAEATWIPDTTQEFPMTMPAVVTELAGLMGLDVDERTVLNPEYTIGYPAHQYTVREVLCHIAAAHGGNWVITPQRKLRLIPLFDDTTPEHNVGLGVSSFESYTPVGAISGVSLGVDENNAYQSGNDTTYMFETDCDWGTQKIADDLLVKLSGKTYYGYTAAGAILPLNAELGDRVSIGESTNSFIANMVITFGPAHMADISAPGENEIEHEYPYQSKMQRELKKKISQGTYYHGVAISRDKGLMVQKTDGENIVGEAVFNSDELSMRAVIDGKMKDCIYFDTQKGRYRLSGDVVIDGTMESSVVITDALYAEQGDIAQLTVDWIDTSKKVYKYLTKDTTSDFHFVGHGTSIEFIKSDVVMDGETPTTVQLVNRYGDSLYWKKDISNADIVNGYPYIDGERVLVTTEQTLYPVMVYQYTDLVMREIAFKQDPETTYWFPTDLYGVGTDDGGINGRGKILKTSTGFELTYTTSNGDIAGVYMRDDGFVDAKHRRADITVDTTNKKFLIAPEGTVADDFEIQYEDLENGISMTWPDGEVFKVVVK